MLNFAPLLFTLSATVLDVIPIVAPVSESNIGYDDEFEPNRVLASWYEASTDLYLYFNAIATHLANHSVSNPYIGQCLVHQLARLVITMPKKCKGLQRKYSALPRG